MKTTIIVKVAAMLLMALTITACKGNKTENGSLTNESVSDSIPFVLKHLGVDKSKVMPYVTCSEATVDALLAIADTVYSRTDSYTLRDLGFDDKNYNKINEEQFNDTIPLVVALYDSYDRLTCWGDDETNTAFVWHEVARLQMKQFCEASADKRDEPICKDRLLKVIENIIGIYGCGSQAEMNAAAWRQVMPTDYLLIDAYKQLADLSQNKDIIQLIHDDYMYTLTTFREHDDAIEHWYSDLPREEGELFTWMLQSKLSIINMLIKDYKEGTIGDAEVKKNLKEHLCVVKNGREKLTKELLDGKRYDFS